MADMSNPNIFYLEADFVILKMKALYATSWSLGRCHLNQIFMMHTILSVLRHTTHMFLFILLSISSSFSQENVSPSVPFEVPPIRYLADIDKDGVFEVLPSEQAPIPSQGREKFSAQFSSMIYYPALAREDNITGVVILKASIDEGGKVLSVEIKQSLRKDCDDAAIKAFKSITAHGYAPLILEGNPVKYQMEIPIVFWLG